jgi:hypothetical protein
MSNRHDSDHSILISNQLIMAAQDLYVDNAWDQKSKDPTRPAEQRFFQAYGDAVDSRTFGQESMTKWYSSKVVYRSETGKLFHGANEMKAWMDELFFSFEKINHILEYYVQYKIGEATKVHVGFRRQLWIKGNVGAEPDTDTPVAWICEIGPTDDADGYLGLQFKHVSLHWDKTRTVEMLKKNLPSDS